MKPNQQRGPGYRRFQERLGAGGAESLRQQVLREQEAAMSAAEEAHRSADANQARERSDPVVEPDYPPPRYPRKRR